MKPFSVLLTILFLITVNLVSAQDINHGDQKYKTNQVEMQQAKTSDASVLDKLQKETEDISVMKPLFFIASVISERIELRKLEKEFVAAIKAREAEAR